MVKKYVRFPNDSYFIETLIDMTIFKPNKEFSDEIFGWYNDIYISIKK